MKFGLTGHFPDVLWDGYFNQSKLVNGKMPQNLRICINNGALDVLNADGNNNSKTNRQNQHNSEGHAAFGVPALA